MGSMLTFFDYKLLPRDNLWGDGEGEDVLKEEGGKLVAF